MVVFQTHFKFKRLPYTLKNIVKPNFIPSELQHSQQKRWVSLGLWLMRRVWQKVRFSMIFTVLVASVQPNLQELRKSRVHRKVLGKVIIILLFILKNMT